MCLFTRRYFLGGRLSHCNAGLTSCLLNFEWGSQAAGLWADSSVLVVYGMRLVCDIGSIEFHSLQHILYFSVP